MQAPHDEADWMIHLKKPSSYAGLQSRKIEREYIFTSNLHQMVQGFVQRYKNRTIEPNKLRKQRWGSEQAAKRIVNIRFSFRPWEDNTSQGLFLSNKLASINRACTNFYLPANGHRAFMWGGLYRYIRSQTTRFSWFAIQCFCKGDRGFDMSNTLAVMCAGVVRQESSAYAR